MNAWDCSPATHFLLLLFELKMRLDFILSLEGHDDYICNLIKMHVILLLALNILSTQIFV